MMRPTVLLFDIDGTLISSGGVGRRALEATFRARFGTDSALGFPFGGMTDRAIVRDALAVQCSELTGLALEQAIDDLLALYLHELEASASRATSFRVHAGIEQALTFSGRRPNTAIGLGTGNVRRGAEIKLRRVGLFEHFGFGGFGCDHIDRSQLLRIGADRGAAALGLPRSECRVVVIGDTPKDIAAARAIGAECIAVATGSFPLELLSAAQPTWAFPDLTAQGALEALLPRS